MARTSETSLRFKNAGVFLPGSFNTIDLNGSLTGTDEGGGVIDVSGTGGAGSTPVTHTLTDTGDHQNFTAPSTITSVFLLATSNGQYISVSNYTFSGTNVKLSSSDAGVASVGLELTYA